MDMRGPPCDITHWKSHWRSPSHDTAMCLLSPILRECVLDTEEEPGNPAHICIVPSGSRLPCPSGRSLHGSQVSFPCSQEKLWRGVYQGAATSLRQPNCKTSLKSVPDVHGVLMFASFLWHIIFLSLCTSQCFRMKHAWLCQASVSRCYGLLNIIHWHRPSSASF